jgi:hypothetical protein
MMVRLNMNEVEVQRPENLAKLKAQGIDAFLSVRASGAYDGQPQGASARVVSTGTGRLIAGVTWQNAWGGQAGSIADRTMRKGLNEASVEIANALAACAYRELNPAMMVMKSAENRPGSELAEP